MTVRPIRIFGDPGLRMVTETVTSFDRELAALVADMTETMYAAPGVGLAANQVGVGLRVFVYDVGDGPSHIVNPVLETSEPLYDEDEGCLSVPGLSFPTVRSEHATVTGADLHGEPVAFSGSGLLARCFQHEVGHLQGRLYLDELQGPTAREAKRAVRTSEWFTASPAMTQLTEDQFRTWYS